MSRIETMTSEAFIALLSRCHRENTALRPSGIWTIKVDRALVEREELREELIKFREAVDAIVDKLEAENVDR